jgi:DNA-binding response OmpR family regulator
MARDYRLIILYTCIDVEDKSYLLTFLYANRERTCTRDEIRRAVWLERDELLVTDREIDTLVRRLRQKIEPDAENPTYIVTVRSMRGLRFGQNG